MKAHITKSEQMLAPIEALYKKQLAFESAKAGIQIGNAALQMAARKFGDRIRNGTPEDSRQAALEMLEWCESKKCEDVQEGKTDGES